eukprot:3389161-Pleurochrysis_carterae.AAC.1
MKSAAFISLILVRKLDATATERCELACNASNKLAQHAKSIQVACQKRQSTCQEHPRCMQQLAPLCARLTTAYSPYAPDI